MRDSLDILRIDDFVEHHGVKGMHWGVRKQKMKSGKRESFLKRLNDRANERTVNAILNNTRKKTIKQINKLEKKQYKLAKPYADKNGHFKITDPKKASKHHEYSEKIVNLKKLLKDIDDGKIKLKKKYASTSMDTVQLHNHMHQQAMEQHRQILDIFTQQQVNQINMQNQINDINFMNMINMQNIHTANMHTMGMF